jgi:hypothetical protein
MSTNTYPGISIFPSFRTGSFNWLDNHNRPFFNIVWTKKSGKKAYQDVFLNLTQKDGSDNPSIAMSETKTHIVLKIAKSPGLPIGNARGKMFE